METTKPVHPDVIITPSNYMNSFKRVLYCLKEKGFVRVGMTVKNEPAFNDLLKEIEYLGIKFSNGDVVKYKAGSHDAICRTIRVSDVNSKK